MKVPGNATGKVFKCVKCGAHVQGTGSTTAPPESDAPPALEPVGQLLVQAGAITPLHLDEALGVQRREGGKTFELLIRLGYLDKARLHEILSKQSGIAAIDLSRVSISREIAALVPRELALQQLVLPIDQLGKLLTVAMACPLDVATIAEIEKLTGLKVKAMLCRYDDIQAAVQKHYPEEGLGEGEMPTFQLPPGFELQPKEDVADKLNRLEDLHYRADVLEKVATLAKDSATTLGQVVEIVIHDPAFTAAILRTANSAVYGMSGQVESLHLAITLLGRDGLGALVVQSKKANVAPQKSLDPLYARSLSTARHAAMLARATGRVGREVAFTAGILHLIGAYAIEKAAPQRYGKVKTEADRGTLAAEEKAAFGMGHPEAGAVVLKRWRLPESLQVAVAQYLSPDNAPKQNALPSLVNAATATTPEEAGQAAGAKPDALARAQREEDALLQKLRALAF